MAYGETRAAGARKEGGKTTFDAGFLPSFRALAGDNFARLRDCWGNAEADRKIC